MSLAPRPQGDRRMARLRDRVREIAEATAKLREIMPDINDAVLRPRLEAVLTAASDGLAAYSATQGPALAEVLADVLSGLRELEFPARDPDEDYEPPAMERLRAARGLFLAALLDALAAAEALGWKPGGIPLPQAMAVLVARDELELKAIAQRLTGIELGLGELLRSLRDNEGIAAQRSLVNFYVKSVHVEISLARMHIRIGDTTIDFAALWRAGETIVELTGDFLATVHGWTTRVGPILLRAAEAMVRPVRHLARGLAAAARWVTRRRPKPPQEPPPPTEPPADFDEAKVPAMLVAGEALPRTWLPFIKKINLDGETKFFRLATLAGCFNLVRLDADRTSVSDLSALQGLTQLEVLSLDGTSVSALSALQGLTQLERLYLSGTSVSDLSALQGLTQLQRLWLTGTSVSDLSALQGLTQLQRLDLSRTSVSDLSALQGLTQLQWLSLTGTSVSDLSALADLIAKGLTVYGKDDLLERLKKR